MSWYRYAACQGEDPELVFPISTTGPASFSSWKPSVSAPVVRCRASVCAGHRDRHGTRRVGRDE
jgi:hypothetical protein